VLVAAATVSILLLGGRVNGGRTPHVIEYAMPVAEAMPTAIALGDDGAVWFTIGNADWLGRLRSGVIEKVPTEGENLDPLGLAIARDGSAWYTDIVARAIVRVTPSGTVSRFGLDTPVARLGRLAIAADGAVWFAELSENSISELSEGSFIRHDVESAQGGPYGVAVGGDGTVWGSLQSGNQIVRVDREGHVSAIDLPRRGAGPTDVAVAPDGAVWFIEFRANALARYKDGRVEDYPMGDEPVGLSGLAVGTDGAVWVGMLRKSSLGRWRDGALTVFRLPRSEARPYTLASDRVGNVWYADISGTIGMLPAGEARR
jgi:virginiamycin B lyase